MSKKSNEPVFLIVGQSYSGLTSYLKSQGYDYIVLRDIKGARNPEKKLKRRTICDFTSRKEIFKAVDSINKNIIGVLVHYENYVLPAAWIAEHLRLPGLSPAAALMSTDKVLMREAFSTSTHKLNPDFCTIETEQDLRDFASSHDFPLILKPANLVKSMLITRSANLDELLQNYRELTQSIDSTYTKYAPGRQPKIILEEFLIGTMHTIAAFVDMAGTPHFIDQIVDIETAKEAGFDDNFLFRRSIPSNLHTSEQDKLFKCAADGINALQLRATPAHIEIILTKNGPRIIEIGARIGGYRERMHAMGNGINLIAAAVNTSLGKAPALIPKYRDAVTVFELFPKISGVFAGIKGEEIIRSIPSLKYFSQKASIGSYVGKASEGYKCTAIIILHNKDAAQLQADAKRIKQEVSVRTGTFGGKQ